MNEQKPKRTEWALGALPAEQAAEYEAGLDLAERSEAEAHRDFCERAARAMSIPAASLPTAKRTAVLAAFAAREACSLHKVVHRRRAIRALSGTAAALMVLAAALAMRGWREWQQGPPAMAAAVQRSEPVLPPDKLEMANYRLAALAAYLDRAETEVREAEEARRSAESEEAEERGGEKRAPAVPQSPPEASIFSREHQPAALAQFQYPL